MNADFSSLLSLLNSIGWSIPLFVLAFAAVWFAKVLYQWTEKFDFSDQLTEKDNPAFGTALAGYLLGVTVALTGAFPDPEVVVNGDTLLVALRELAWQGILVAILMRLSVWIISRFVLYKFGVDYEMIHDRNVGAGAVLAGGSIAVGFLLHGALSGKSDPDLWYAPGRDLLVYWVAGQIILVVGAWLYIHAVHFDVEKVIQDDNIPAGFSLGGYLAAIGIIINASLYGGSSDLGFGLLKTLVVALVGLVLLVCSAIIGARVFLPNSPISKEIAVDKNPAAGLISAASFIAIAVLFVRVIIL